LFLLCSSISFLSIIINLNPGDGLLAEEKNHGNVVIE
jgi:hypothetical protein